MDLNKAQVIGNITSDIELKQVANGNSVTNFLVATNRSWTNSNGEKQEQAEFHNIEMWGKLAEIVDKYLQKGSKVFIEGRLQTKSWEAEDGSKRYKTSIVAENMIMLGGKGQSGEVAEKTTTKTTKAAPAKEEDISVEEIPF